MPYRDDADALALRRAALEHEVATTARELDEASRALHGERHLPVLANLRVASPCKARWSAMVGDERKRTCGDCSKTVFNLSALTRHEAEALVREHAGELCARYYERADGTILLADCTVNASERRRKVAVVAGAAVLTTAIASAIPDDDPIDLRRPVAKPAVTTPEDPFDEPIDLETLEEIIQVQGSAPKVEVKRVVMGALRDPVSVGHLE